MKNLITIEEMNQINTILLTGSQNKQYVGVEWIVKIPGDLDFWNRPQDSQQKSNQFFNDLFSSYRSEKLSTYKKVFDFAHKNDIDLFSIFNDLRFHAENSGFSRYPEYLDLIHYVYQKNYFQPGHDFSIYFNQFNKPTKTNIAAQVKLLDTLDSSEKSFHIYCKLFESFLKLVPYPDVNEQENIQKLFLKFEHEPFFKTFSEAHQKFYPSLLQVECLSDIQEDDYYSKRFCFSANHRVSTLVEAIDNSLTFIYNNVFTYLKEKESVADYYTFSEQGFFYLYVFTTEPEQLNLIGKTVNTFHNEIQSFLQNNTASEDYYIKLFDTLCLAEKLASKESLQDLPRETTPKKKKI